MELTQEYFDQQIGKLITKDDATRFVTKEDLLELPTKTEVRALRDDVAEIKALVMRIDQRTDEDLRAVARDVSNLKRRVSVLERR